MFEGLFSIWQIFYPTLEKCDAIGQVLIFVDSQTF